MQVSPQSPLPLVLPGCLQAAPPRCLQRRCTILKTARRVRSRSGDNSATGALFLVGKPDQAPADPNEARASAAIRPPDNRRLLLLRSPGPRRSQIRRQRARSGRASGRNSPEDPHSLSKSDKTNSLYGLRDRAVLGTLIYTGARVGAISRLRIENLRDHGNHRALQFAEKGGKSREVPVRHDLDEGIAAYRERRGLADAPKGSALFRAGQRRGSPLTELAMSPLAVQLMLKRRLRAAGLPEILSPHSFRVLVVTDLLSQNVPLEVKVSRIRGRFISAVYVGLGCNTPSVVGEQDFHPLNVNGHRKCQGFGH